MSRTTPPCSSRHRVLVGLGALALVALAGCAERAALPMPTHAPRQPSPERPTTDEALPAEPIGESRAEVEAPTPKPVAPRLDLPPRPAGAESGTAFLEGAEGLGRAAMDEAVVASILSGNVPDHLRTLVPITLTDERGRVAVLHVTCDYLAIGSDEDFMRMPMTSAAAQRIADRLGMSLPTPKLVDAIYAQAVVRLPPSWIDGGPTEGTLADYAVHNRKLEERRKRDDHPLGVLVAGHKKDVVLCEKMFDNPNKVAIYGWHEREGKVVQPLSTRHSCRYADYSHGIRLVDEQMTIDGVVHRVSDVLADPDLAPILSEDGALSATSYSTILPEYTGPAGKSAARKKKPRGDAARSR